MCIFRILLLKALHSGTLFSEKDTNYTLQEHCCVKVLALAERWFRWIWMFTMKFKFNCCYSLAFKVRTVGSVQHELL